MPQGIYCMDANLDKDNIDVSDDNIFLQLLIEKHNITPKQLAGWTGRSLKMIYKYLAGDCTIPSIVWRTIFDHTLDVTVFNIIKGDIPCILATMTGTDYANDYDALKHLLKMRKTQLHCEELVLRILEDGVIDQSDLTTIANFKLAFPDMINSQVQMHQAIIRKFEKLEAKA